MFDSMYLPLLLAQQQNTFFDSLIKLVYIVGIFALIFVLPFVLGSFVARAVRMRGYEFKLGLVFASLALALLVLSRAWDNKTKSFDIPLGVDLKGGVILIYEIEASGGLGEDQQGQPTGDINMNDLVQALTNRINPSGTKEIVIRPYGERQVEIIIPEVETEEVERIKRDISTAGQLEFRIVANQRDNADIIEAAEQQSEGPDRHQRRVMDGGEMVGFWAEAAQEKLSPAELEGTILRDSRTGRFVKLSEIGTIKNVDQKLADFLKGTDFESLDVLLATDDVLVTGDNLGVVSAGNDEYLRPCVNFRLRGQGAQLFRGLTSRNRPDMDAQPPFYRHLAIMLDERLLSFPRLITTISESGRITGEFTKDEVDFLVGILRAGRLPATLKKEPISENQIGSMLGDDTIRKGKVSIVVSLVAVLIFVAVYYRFSGLVACTALLMNLVLIMATMVLLNAPLTLPGLAGLVLTIGMSVDANVLIFERIREELARGAALRMAIRNGFGRATTTIVDANVTTLITAMVLYAIGTDQIRGFAVTLILGILMSMYTAIFCSRIVFDIAERRRWITQLNMMKLLGTTKLDFIGRRRIALAGSLLLIAIGMVAVVTRGREIFDIDFNGGLSVTMVLSDPMSPNDVRGRLTEHFEDANPPIHCWVNTVSVEDRPENTVYKIDADIQEKDVRVLEDAIQATFCDASGNSELQSYAMDFADLKEVGAAAKPTTRPVKTVPAESPSEDAPPSRPSGDEAPPATSSEPTETGPAQADPAPTDQPDESDADDSTSQRRDLPADDLLAWAGPSAGPAEDGAAPVETDADDADKSDNETEQAEPIAKQPPVVAGDAAVTTDFQTPAQPAAGDATPESEIRTIAKLTFGAKTGAPTLKINAPTLRDKLKQAYTRFKLGGSSGQGSFDEELDVPGLVVCPDDSFNWDQKSAASHNEWYISMIAPQSETEQVLTQMKTDLATTAVFPSSSKVGGKVAGDTRNLAIAALVASLFGIVGYIWIRFQRVVFGVAAVVALVHDILITLGAIAISAYIAKPLGFLLIDEFRISLPVVAAFLTIIGYSLNDTIVVFDRIREVRGKSPDLTAGMINTSINQTLSRTLLTSLTTLIVVAILYAIGGQGIHGFAFALVVGVLVGTYSSIFVASPALLWMFNLSKATK